MSYRVNGNKAIQQSWKWELNPRGLVYKTSALANTSDTSNLRDMETKGIEPFTRCLQDTVANPWNIRPRAMIEAPIGALRSGCQ